MSRILIGVVRVGRVFRVFRVLFRVFSVLFRVCLGSLRSCLGSFRSCLGSLRSWFKGFGVRGLRRFLGEGGVGEVRLLRAFGLGV